VASAMAGIEWSFEAAGVRWRSVVCGGRAETEPDPHRGSTVTPFMFPSPETSFLTCYPGSVCRHLLQICHPFPRSGNSLPHGHLCHLVIILAHMAHRWSWHIGYHPGVMYARVERTFHHKSNCMVRRYSHNSASRLALP